MIAAYSDNIEVIDPQTECMAKVVHHEAGNQPIQGQLAVAEVIEPMGPETNLYATSGAHSFAARLPAGERVALQQKVSLVFDMRRAHFFDPASEKAIVG